MSQAQGMKNGGSAIIAGKKEYMTELLESRGLDEETASRLGLRGFADRIEFPYVRDGVEKYAKVRGKDKTFSINKSGEKPFFWNIDVLQDESSGLPLMITEGEFDTLAAIQCGHVRTVSVPNGSQGENGNLPYLDEVEDYLRSQKEIILAFDDDEKGHALLQAFGNRLGRARLKWVRYPKECKDLNDALVKYGEKGVKESISRSQWLRVDGVYKMSDLPPIPYARPHSIDMAGFEAHLNIRMGDFSVWTGVPSSGKSTFLNDVICRLNVRYDYTAAIASFEQNPQQDHRRALRTWKAGKLAKHMTEGEIQNADKWIDSAFMFIVPDDDDEVTLEWVLEKCATAVIRHGVKIVVIDPWNEMDHQRPHGMSLTEYTGHAIREFKKFAKKYQVHVAVVAHPAKMRRDKDGQFPVPTLYDISDSAHWNNKADLGVVVHRSEDGDFIQVCKSRYHNEIGRPGIIDVKFNMENGRYMAVDSKVLAGYDNGNKR